MQWNFFNRCTMLEVGEFVAHQLCANIFYTKVMLSCIILIKRYFRKPVVVSRLKE